MSENEAVQNIIDSVNELSREDRRRLCVAVRTKQDGIKAYQAFNYGTGEPELISIEIPDPGSDNPS